MQVLWLKEDPLPAAQGISRPIHGCCTSLIPFPPSHLSQSCVSARDGMAKIFPEVFRRTFRRVAQASSLRVCKRSSTNGMLSGAGLRPHFRRTILPRRGLLHSRLPVGTRSHQCKSFSSAREPPIKGNRATPCAGSGTRGFSRHCLYSHPLPFPPRAESKE